MDPIKLKHTDYSFKAIRASGPGGQHVNKVSTAVQITFPISASSLSEKQKARLLANKHKYILSDGKIIMTAKRYKSQIKNKEDAVKRLIGLITRLLATPKPRKPTRPTNESIEKRLKQKSMRSKLKKSRRKTLDD